ncbi:MAG: hypothetical protein JWO56_133 [Acidobacteria bacterium]|nr:hypothetical protein [Acidobacteriota bacterium]
MPSDHSADLERLVAALRSRVADYDRQHRRRFPVSPYSRILAGERKNPGIFTIRDLAGELGTRVGDLLGEQGIGDADRVKVEELVTFVIERFGLFRTSRGDAEDGARFRVPEEEFVERDYDYPRPHHVWIVPHAKAAAGGGVESDRDTETTEVLHSIRDVYNAQLRVIRVIGDSMSPALRDGDKVTVDTRLTSPSDGQVVAVYHHTDGGILGYWRRGQRGEFWLDKENAAFEEIRLGREARDWTLWGTVTRIVDTPAPIRRRR